MNESLQRVVEAAKKHPYMTAGIVGGVILLAWWMSKNKADSSVEINPGSMLGNGSGSGSGGSLGSTDSGSIPLFPIPTESVPTNPFTGSGSSNDLPSIPSDTWFDSGLGLPSIPALQVPGGGSVFSGNGSGMGPGSKGSESRTRPQSTPATPAPTGTRGGRNMDRDTSRDTSNMTPAQLVGKGRRFTGWFNGIAYINGYPVTGTGVTLIGVNESSGGYVAGRTPTPKLPAGGTKGGRNMSGGSIGGNVTKER